jgi:hypothetical protein
MALSSQVVAPAVTTQLAVHADVEPLTGLVLTLLRAPASNSAPLATHDAEVNVSP